MISPNREDFNFTKLKPSQKFLNLQFSDVLDFAAANFLIV